MKSKALRNPRYCPKLRLLGTDKKSWRRLKRKTKEAGER